MEIPTISDLLESDLNALVNDHLAELVRDTHSKQAIPGKRSLVIKVTLDTGDKNSFVIDVMNNFPKEKTTITLKVDPEQGNLFKAS